MANIIILEYPHEHKDAITCSQSNSCKTQVRVCAIYDNQAITFTYYRVDKLKNKGKLSQIDEDRSSEKFDTEKEVRYRRWLRDTPTSRSVLNPSSGSNNADESPRNLDGTMAEAALSIDKENVMNFAAFRAPYTFEPLPFTDDDCIDPLTFPNIRTWHTSKDLLRKRMQKALLGRMYEQNKQRALWIVRHMVVDWEKGTGIKAEDECIDNNWGFIRVENVREVVLALI